MPPYRRPPDKVQSVTKLAQQQIGPPSKYKSLAEYKVALVRARKRIRETMDNKAIIEAVEQKISKRPAGVETEYRGDFARVARLVCSVYGSTIEELAKYFRVSPQTIQSWIESYPEFERAIRDRSTEMNMQIMGRLARRALGFYANTEKIFYDVRRGDVVKVPTKEYYPPSEAAIMFWLKNRMPEQWKDLKDVNVDQTNKITMEIYKNFDSMTAEQASDAYQELLKLDAPAQVQADPKRKKNGAIVTDAEYTERDPKRKPI